MIDPEKLNSLPSRSLLPRPEDVSHVATIGVRVAVDRQLVAGDVVGCTWEMSPIRGPCLTRRTARSPKLMRISVDV